MKKILLLTAILFVSLFKSQSTQTFQNFTISPSSPTTTDNIRIITEVGFSSNANAISKTFVQTGNVININRCYFLGMLTIIDNHKDTVNVGLLPAGVYIVNYNGVLSNSLSTCVPSGQTFSSSITFTVIGTPAGVNEIGMEANEVLVYPNPFENYLMINLKSNKENFGLKVYDCVGKLVYEEKNYISGKEIGLLGLSSGVYFVEVISQNKTQERIKVRKN